MKITSGWGSLPRNIHAVDGAPANGIKRSRFSDTMQQQEERSHKEHLQMILKRIQDQADQLRRTMTVKELRKYKQLVRSFLDETIRKGVGLKETQGRDRRGRSKRYKLLSELDQALLELTDELLEHEQGRVELLRRVGEMKGLLVNLTY